jgi:uncharacterized protein
MKENVNEEFLKRKMEKVISKLKEKGSVLVALSGGVDSSLVAKLAKIALGDKVLAVTADSMTLPPGELEEAKKIAKEIGVKHLIIQVNELSNPNFAENPPERCYYCKKELISELKRIAREHNLAAIVDGTNAEDLKGHRPGALALIEEGVFSPLADVGLTKNDVRKLAKMLGLSTAEKPSMACLSSRFPYLQRITQEKLRRVAEAEKTIKQLTGIKELRVRDHGDIARVEVGRNERKLLYNEQLMDTIAGKLKALGFKYVTMDLQGYRSGSMDELLERKIIPEGIHRK